MKTWKFGINNDYLVDLILSGKKRATTSLYESGNFSTAGEVSIFTFSNGNIACITKTSRVVIIRGS